MKVEQRQWTATNGWIVREGAGLTGTPQLVLVFGARQVLSDPARFAEVKGFYPDSHIIMGSTAGEIYDVQVSENTISLAAVQFEKTEVKVLATNVVDSDASYDVGKQLAGQLDQRDLAHVMVFSEGVMVNGTRLARGLAEALPPTVAITGGLVGDGSNFIETVAGLDEVPVSSRVIIIGFYGSALKVGYGSFGGWDTFGPERIVTKSSKNILYELDDKPALELYKQYLGEQAAGLPASGLLFPMSLRMQKPDGSEMELVRTVLSVNEQDQSVTFAGDMPEGVYCRLMKANFDRLIDGAATAASMSIEPLDTLRPELAILISCIGRKLVLQERVEEETEAVRGVLGPQSAMIGFYSYGEICPTAATEKQCQFHNQTMTITGFRED